METEHILYVLLTIETKWHDEQKKKEKPNKPTHELYLESYTFNRDTLNKTGTPHVSLLNIIQMLPSSK